MIFFRRITAPFLLASLALSIAHASDTDAINEQLKTIYQQLHQNAQKSARVCADMQTAIAENGNVDAQFMALVKAWKTVEATYLLGDLDADAIDIPNYIDVYHKGNENLSKQMQRALKSSQEAKIALFKHSFKSINALEIVLANADKPLQERQQAFAIVITDNVCKRLKSIDSAYANNQAEFLANQDKAVALLLNTLIDSSYKLKEWRIGDVLGTSRKYKGKPNSSRAEYVLSNNSINAIRAILATHNALMNGDDGTFATIIQTLAEKEGKADAIDALTAIQTDLTHAVKLAAALTDKDLATEKTKPLFDAVAQLHDGYYVGLVRTLDVVAKILEADGD